MRKTARAIVFGAVLLGIWQTLAMLGVWPEFVFPGPEAVIKSLVTQAASGALLLGIGISLKRVVIGFIISVLVGTLTGFAIARVKLVEDTIGILVLGLQTLPSICWLPLAILWFGLQETAVIFVVVVGALLSIAIATADAVRNIPPIYAKAGAVMGARGRRLYTHVIIPAALPATATGLKLGWSFAWRALMAGELLFVSGGLGFLLNTGRQLNDAGQVMSVMIVIVALGLLVDRLVFFQLEKRIRRRWGLT